jgi:hypothetical protein
LYAIVLYPPPGSGVTDTRASGIVLTASGEAAPPDICAWTWVTGVYACMAALWVPPCLATRRFSLLLT